MNAYAALSAAAVALVALIAPLVWRIFSRPVLIIDFENRRRWRRPAIDATTGREGLYFRVRVTNNGWRSASMVTGIAAEFLDTGGTPLLDVDPFVLHWSGTPWGAAPAALSLLPGQSEYLDVFRINSNPILGPGLSDQDFELLPKDPTPRGIRTVYPIAGQVIRVVVLADDATGIGYELKLPDRAPPAPVLHLSVKHRPVDRFGLGLVPWAEQPPPRIVGGVSIAGVRPGE